MKEEYQGLHELGDFTTTPRVLWVSALALVIGVIFGVLTMRVTVLRASSIAKGFVLGAVAGLVTFILVFLPVEIPPMPGLVSSSNFLLESLGYNLVYGIVLGVIVAGLTLMTQKPKTTAPNQ